MSGVGTAAANATLAGASAAAFGDSSLGAAAPALQNAALAAATAAGTRSAAVAAGSASTFRLLVPGRQALATDVGSYARDSSDAVSGEMAAGAFLMYRE